MIPRHHVIIWKHAILTQRVSLPKSFFLLGSRADLGHRKGGGCARKPNDQKIKSVVTCSVRIQDRVRCTSLTNLCLRKLRGTTRPTRLGPSGWEVVILSSCGVSPKPGCLIHSWRGGEAANRALLQVNNPCVTSCHRCQGTRSPWTVDNGHPDGPWRRFAWGARETHDES